MSLDPLEQVTYHIKSEKGYAADYDNTRGTIIWCNSIMDAAWWSKRGAISLAELLAETRQLESIRVIALCKNSTIEKCVKRIK